MTIPKAQEGGAEPTQVVEAISELTTRWGYRDVTKLLQAHYQQLQETYPEEEWSFAYLCVLQTPEGGPVYCRQAARVSKELDTARAAGHRYDQCPALDPTNHLWMVIGNFESDEEGRRS